MSFQQRPRKFKAPKKLDASSLWDYALRALAGRPHSAAELRQKLARRAESPDLLGPTMDKLREYGFADDTRFSQTFATARLENQGFGRGRVLRDLRTKRVTSKVAEEAVASVFTNVDELQLAEQFLRRRYRGKDLPAFLTEEKNLAAAYRRLRTAGFTNANSLAVLKKFKNDLPEWEDDAEPEDLA